MLKIIVVLHAIELKNTRIKFLEALICYACQYSEKGNNFFFKDIYKDDNNNHMALSQKYTNSKLLTLIINVVVQKGN